MADYFKLISLGMDRLVAENCWAIFVIFGKCPMLIDHIMTP